MTNHDGGAASAGQTIESDESLPVRLWRAAAECPEPSGSSVAPAAMTRSVNLWGDEAVLLGRVLRGYLGDLRTAISTAADAAMRRDLRHDDQLLEDVLERLA